MKKLLLTLLSAAFLCSCNNAQAPSSEQTPDQIKASLLKSIPGLTKIDSISKSQVNGIDEVVVGRKVFYVTSDGKYMFFGNLIDIASKKSLTEQRTQELSKINWSQLPLDLAIKNVIGTGKRQIAVFSDPDCPYCQMFERQVVSQLKDTTVYTFLFPLPIHPNAKSDATKIWCSKDRLATWTAWMRDKKALPTNTSCDTSGMDKIYKVATDVVQVEGTPTIILSNGTLLPGMLPADQLMSQMDAASKK